MPRTAKKNPGAQIIAALEGVFSKYVILDSGLPLVLALWTVATHLFECFDAFPYLAITSPTKRCGKTRLAEVIELFCVNGLRTVGATPAAIFRRIQMSQIEGEGDSLTLIMDEAEVLHTKSEVADALREILNAGYRRGQCVMRCERNSEGRFEVKEFTVYCPKVIVLIGNLNDTLADRCIPVAMRRRKLTEHVERFFPSQAEKETRHLRKEVANWAKASRRSVKRNHRQKNVEFLEDREAELWAPLFAICTTTAPDRLEHLKGIALRVSRAKQADEPADMGILLLKDIRNIFDRNATDRLATTTGLIPALEAIEESPWATWRRGSGLDARALARLLKPFKIEPHNLRLENDHVAKGYTREDFAEAWATYLPADASTEPLQVGEDGGVADPERVRSGDPEGQTANNSAVCSAVAGQDAPVDPNDPRLFSPLNVNLKGDAYVFDMKRRRRRRG